MHGRMHTRCAAVAAGVTVVASSLLTLVGTTVASAAVGATHGPAGTRLRPTNPNPNPKQGFPESLGLTGQEARVIGAGLVVALLLLGILVLRVRRRRRAGIAPAAGANRRVFPQRAESFRGSGLALEAAGPLPKFTPSTLELPSRPPGWHPISGDPTRIAYWDGGQWAAYRLWDGRQWVEPHPPGG
jgi:hypothetical protein